MRTLTIVTTDITTAHLMDNHIISRFLDRGNTVMNLSELSRLLATTATTTTIINTTVHNSSIRDNEEILTMTMMMTTTNRRKTTAAHHGPTAPINIEVQTLTQAYGTVMIPPIDSSNNNIGIPLTVTAKQTTAVTAAIIREIDDMARTAAAETLEIERANIAATDSGGAVIVIGNKRTSSLLCREVEGLRGGVRTANPMCTAVHHLWA